MGELLRQSVAQLQPVPAGIAERARQRIRLATRRRALLGAAALAAGVLAAIAGWWFASERRHDELPSPVVVEKAASPHASSPEARPLVRVTFAPASDVIAVPIETNRPNLTMIWVYPTVRPEAKATADSSISPETPERNDI
jgi:hypothetical protein